MRTFGSVRCSATHAVVTRTSGCTYPFATIAGSAPAFGEPGAVVVGAMSYSSCGFMKTKTGRLRAAGRSGVRGLRVRLLRRAHIPSGPHESGAGTTTHAGRAGRAAAEARGHCA